MEMLLMSYLAGTESITKKYLSKMVSNKIVFIPTAGNVEPYTGYIDEGIEMLKSLGYEVEILDITKFDETYLKDKFLKTECICISGGNTFYLLQEIKRKNLVEVLFKRIKEGLFYIGESAGAIIMSENIEYSQKIINKEVRDSFLLRKDNFYLDKDYQKDFDKLKKTVPENEIPEEFQGGIVFE